MMTKPKKILAQIQMRAGDIVFHKEKNGHSYGYGVVGATDAWWLLEQTVEVFFDKGMGTIVDFKELKIVKERDKIREWWRFFDHYNNKGEYQKLLKIITKEKI